MKPYPNLQRRIRIAVCATLACASGVAMAQTTPATATSPQTMPSQATPASTPQARSAHKAVYDSPKRTLVVKSSMPKQRDYGPAPDFKTLDSNHDGRLSKSEAGQYVPLANDFLYVSHGAKSISRSQYKRWVKTS